MTLDELRKYVDKRLAELAELRVYIDKRLAELERRTGVESGMMRLEGGYWPTIPMSEAQTGGYTYEEKFETVPPPAEETETPPVTEAVVVVEETLLSQAECLVEAAISGATFVEGGATN